mgnify:CR=1 FL=1
MRRPGQRTRLCSGRALVVGASLAAFALTGCSRLSLAYRFADWRIESKIQDYCAVSGAREEALERWIDDYMRWHRATMVPQYAQFVRDVARSIESRRLTPQRYERLRQKAESLFDDTVAPFPAKLAELWLADRKAQAKALEAGMREQLNEYRQEDETLADRVESIRESFEDFLGQLDARQTRVIRTTAQAFAAMRSRWLDERERRQRELAAMVRESGSAKQIAGYLQAWWTAPERISPVSYQAQLARRRRVLDDLLWGVLSELDEAQRGELVETLEGYAQQLEEL